VNSGPSLASPTKWGNREFLVVLGSGRSGTTIIQHLLNSIPGFDLRGENGGSVWPLIDAIALLHDFRTGDARWASNASTDPWMGFQNIDIEKFESGLIETFVEEVLRPEASARVIGFKEIRFPLKGLGNSIQHIQRLIPRTRFVLAFRNPSSIARSGWWPKQPRAERTIGRQQQALRGVAKSLGERAFSIEYETFHNEESSRVDFFNWLGEEYDSQSVNMVLRTRAAKL